MKSAILSFQGPYRFLSNFYPCTIEYNGLIYPSTEHAYQAAKTNDLDLQRMIAGLTNPGMAKKMGKRVPIRPDWESIKLQVMYDLCKIKFSIPELREKLLATGGAELVEGNTWGDRFFGVCDGEGLNHLGKILMRIRTELSPAI